MVRIIGSKAYTGDNCHADIVLMEPVLPQELAYAEQIFKEAGFAISRDAVLGHFSVLGAEYERNNHTAKLSRGEVTFIEQHIAQLVIVASES